MPRRRRILPGASLAAVLALLLVGCATTPDAVLLEAGDCVAEEFNHQPVRDTVVECSEPHRFDIVAGLGTWPGAEEAIAASDAATVYERLLLGDPSDELVVAFTDWAMPQCERAFRAITGLSGVMMGELIGDDLALEVASPTWLTASLDTAARFGLDDDSVACAVGWLDEASELRTVSFESGATIADLLTGAIPTELRECFELLDDDQRTPVTCESAHTGQSILRFDAGAALGADWVEAVDPVTGQPAEYSAADEVCAALIGQVLTEGALGDGISVWADVWPTEGWAFFDGSRADGATYPIDCAVIAPRGEHLTGDAFAGAVALTAG
ncbi:MAG: hypothetical protein CMF56_00325 [Leifsonia sp.]|nr:hypothetical protein [Leifsonia sp.]|tara:strand:+ start:52027 stop:53007 length:981 start_codon:yes stop_codon:yes gene_type:complete